MCSKKNEKKKKTTSKKHGNGGQANEKEPSVPPAPRRSDRLAKRKEKQQKDNNNGSPLKPVPNKLEVGRNRGGKANKRNLQGNVVESNKRKQIVQEKAESCPHGHKKLKVSDEASCFESERTIVKKQPSLPIAPPTLLPLTTYPTSSSAFIPPSTSMNHAVFQAGEIVNAKYKILDTLGEGIFGRVFKVQNMENSNYLALKVVKSTSRESAIKETQILHQIRQWDPNGEHFCIRMWDWFEYRNHICIVLEKLGLSVYDFQRQNNFQPYSFKEVQSIGYQLCDAVKMLHAHGLTHTDLKPENILFLNSAYDIYATNDHRTVRRIRNCTIRLIDFGCASFGTKPLRTIVTARLFRAPEVILKLGWSQPCDVWSIGCILFELYAGEALFQCASDHTHLAMMQRTLGKIPHRMATESSSKYFINGQLDWNDNPSDGREDRLIHCKPLVEHQRDESGEEFFDLLGKMLKYEPSQRLALGEALVHPFFKKDFSLNCMQEVKVGKEAAASNNCYVS